MKVNVRPYWLVLLAAVLIGRAVAQPQLPANLSPGNGSAGSSVATRQSPITNYQLHPCGLIVQDPRKIPGMILDKPHPGGPRTFSVSGDLSSQMPPVGDQGQQGSCTAWATGYYQKTHYEWREYHWNDSTTSHEFSPAFIYNQINGGADYGSSIWDAFTLMIDQGCASMADCPYNQNDCTSWPSESSYAHAIPNRGSTAHWFYMTDTSGIRMVKQRIDSGVTTVIGIEVYHNWDRIDSFGYKYCVADTPAGSYRGNHAITIVGYNDTLTTHDGTGAFRIVNSWGTYWGQSGYAWMSYKAATDSVLSQQAGFYLDDLIGYTPTMIGRVKITHPARDKVGIRMGVGRPSGPKWTKDFRTWRYPWVDQSFPNHNIVFDMTEGEPYITNGQTDTVFVRCIDDVHDGKTGTINYFAAKHLVWNATAVSPDTPVSIPDSGVGVYARAKMVRPHDVGVTVILAPTGTVDSGSTITPQARVKNFGIDTTTFPVTFHIGSGYTNTQTVSNLKNGDSVVVSFSNWTAGQRGTYATRCSTGLTGDLNHANDTLGGSVTVRVTDVGVRTIIAPTGTVDSGSTITPQARVKNLGTQAATFPVIFRIGSSYNNTQTVTGLAAGDSVVVSFSSWTAGQRGTYATRCSTNLTGDQVHSDDTLGGTVTVRVTDVGVKTIIAPTGTVDSGASITPQARVKNYGTVAVTFPVTFRIGSSYNNTQTVTSLAAGDSIVVSFSSWTAGQRGTYATRCSTGLTGDQVRSNDTLSGSVTVRVTDVGVTAIVAPTGTVDSGSTITPQAKVKNLGTVTATFPATFSIGTGYTNTQTVSNLAAGDSAVVSFSSWTAGQRGTYATRCSTNLTGDQVHTNDTLGGTVTVRVTDVGVKTIIAPTGTVDSGTVITPQARVKNYGTGAATFPVTFRIGSSYNNTQTVTNLAAGDSALVSFTNWTASPRGVLATRCSTALSGDQVHGNDTLSGTVTVRVTDVGVTAIVAPTGTVDSGTTVTPQARVKNFGTVSATFPATFRIGTGYTNTQTVSNLAAGDSALVSFANWTAGQRGTYATRCSTNLTGDQVHSNDTLGGTVTVRVTDVGVTALVAPTGTVDSGTTITPQARVRNFGTVSTTFPATFRIGTGYTNTQTVSNLAAGDSVVVSFSNWTAGQRGTYATRCSTNLTGDQVHTNDTLSGTVTVRVTDVGVSTIVAPTGTVDSGTVITPQARVKNYGTAAATFPVTFRIGSSYNNTQTITNLASGDSILVSFTNWTAGPRGTLATRCSTALSGDQVHGNDTMSGTVTVRVTDVGVTAIVAPTGTVDSGTTVTPQARVRNFGTVSATFPATFRIGTGYTNTQTVSNLAAGDSVLVSFANWTAGQRGTYATRCSTNLTGDQVHVNDTLSGSVTVRVTDVGVAAIIAPTGTVDSGATITPQARVKNYGTSAATFPSTFRIGTGYTNTQTVTSLAAGDSVVVSFSSWTAGQRGTYATRCSTSLSGDQVHSNDTLSGSVTVRVTDVGVAAIVAPTGTVDSGSTITPQARVKNLGTQAATFPVTFRIGSSYNNTQTVTSLAAGDSVLVSFANWTAAPRGTLATRCSTALSGDQVHGNDTLSGTVTVRVTDVGVTALVAPTGTVDSGTTVTPQARVKNFGTASATFPATFRIGTGYTNTQTVSNLAAGDSVLVSFANWTAGQRGTYATRCSTSLTGDQVHVNDTLSGSVIVRVSDVGVTQILAPTGTVDSGSTITPQARVKNYGTGAATFPVTFRIGSSYNNTQTVTNLASGDSLLVSFANWTAAPRGVLATRCSTALSSDQVHTNDTLSGTVTVRVTDVGVAALVAPAGTVDSGTTLTPQARVRNFGTSSATFPATFRIGSSYTNTQTVSNLAAGDSVLVSFSNWTAGQRGTYATRCSTNLTGDQVHVNDTLSGSVIVRVSDVGVTQILAPTGTVDSGTTITPQARVKNYGSAASTFPVTFRIGTGYNNTQTVTNLAAGDSVLVSFANWTAAPRGTLATRCSTALANDQVHSNDTMSGTVTVRVTDVGVTALLAPTGTVDSGTTITPQARVKNFGTVAATFPATFRIGTGYTNTQTVSNLAGGDSVVVSFSNWTAGQRGTYATRCSTNLTGDQVHSNDTLSGSVTVRASDVGVTAIVAPTGTVDSGSTITPQARVKNYGSTAVTFPTTFRIGSSYNNTQTVSNLASGDSVLVSFANWTAGQRGTYATRCSTALSGDQIHTNDTLSGSVTVRVTNVGVTAIIAPPDTVDSGTVVTPKARVKNFGTGAATFPVFFRIGSVYSDSQSVSNLAAGDSIQVSFANWTAGPLGTYVKRCSTALAGDQVHTNDTLSGSVTVKPAPFLDVGVTQIISPTGTIDSGTVVTPKARVRNFGNTTVSFPVAFRIGSFYSNSQTVTNLAAGDSVQVSFTDWTAVQRGTSVTRCTTSLSGDQNHSNDALSGSVTVRVTDVGVTALVAPTGTVDSGTTMTPQARVKNFGTASATFPATFRIGSGYSNTQTVTNLAAGDSVLVSFSNWTAGQRGTYATRCSTNLTGDQVHNNDTLSGSVIVRVLDVGVSQILTPTGTVDSGTTITPQARVKNFGSAAATFPTTFRIGTGYNNTQTVSNLAAGDSVLVSFANWTAGQRGTYATRCSTALSGDLVHANDTLSGSVTVRVTNVGVTAIVAPPDTVDSGSVVTPQARVKNFGTNSATFPVFFRIGSVYSDSQNVTGLAAGDSIQVSFTNWTAGPPGTYAKRCSTALAGDQVHSNDTLSGLVTVKHAPFVDVGVIAIVAPAGTVDSGTTVTPQARVKNHGTSAATFPVTFRIGSFYSNSQTVTNLASGDSTLVSFTNWTAVQRGTSATRCTTALSGDQNHSNDAMSGSVTVRVTDVGVFTIVTPTDTVDSGAVVTPKARVRNYGTDAVTFPVTFRIGSSYTNTQTVSNLASGDSVQVSFANWSAAPRGPLATRCSTALSNDQIHANDTLSGAVVVRVTNVGVTAIAAPTGTIDSGTTVTPQARVKNYGTGSATFPVTFRIGSFYSNSQTVTNLAAGDSILVSFSDWTAVQRGTSVTRCSTNLAGDQVRGNDTMSGSVTVRVTNVGVTAIVAPPDTVDSGTVVTPKARVRNFGTNSATFPVFFRIGSIYSDSQNVTNLAAGDSIQVSFTNWTAGPPGTYVKRCSTALTGDQIHGNDTLSGMVTVAHAPVTDVGVTALIAPTGTVDSGATVTPQARVKNFGTSAATFPATFRIGSSYTNTQTVSNLAAGDSVLVSFANWTAVQRGTSATRCTTALTGDQNHSNDALSGTVTVRVTDVGVTSIVAPTGTVDSGATITPQARVKNFGTASATFPATFRIGSGYNNTKTVSNLAAGDSVLVSFSNWTAGQRGTYATRCSTNLTGDQVHANDTLAGSVTVRVIDVGVAAIVAPVDTVDSGATFTPQARVRNRGTGAASFPVTMSIGTYADTQSVSSLPAGDSILVSFTSWTATARGANAIRCSTALSGDVDHTNDTLRGSVAVRVRDVACIQLLAPPDTIDSGATETPRAVIRNLGTTDETFNARLAIGASYADTVPLTLAAGATDTASFAGWTAPASGAFPILCITMLPTDKNRANDSLRDTVVVLPPTGVAERQVLPRVLALYCPAPDPMRGKSVIRFSIPRHGQVILTVRSITGAVVRTLCNSSLSPAYYSLVWDGRDNSGRRVAPGIYFWRLECENTVITRKAIKLD
ncbi:MAG TPA: CARDB domain-containing protein [bacterium]|nr:CARDB domain-containing protein [bacterium]